MHAATERNGTMRAIVHDRYGPPEVLELREVERPEIADDEVLVRVEAASTHAGDWHVTRGLPYVVRVAGFGLLRPKKKIRGTDIAGRVEAVGASVAGMGPGDEVFGVCEGAFAEYACAKGELLVRKPARLTFEEAATMPTSAVTALHGLRDHGRVQAGQRVLVNGASGGVGTFAVQIAKALGAHVTGVCSTRNVELVRSLGADAVIDYRHEDFTRGGDRWDVVLDIAASHSLGDCRRALTPTGTYVLVGDPGGRWVGGLGRMLRSLLLSPFVRQRLRGFVSMPKHDDLIALKELVEAGAVTPAIDRTYPLSETPAAVAYVEEGHARAKVVIAV